MNGGTLIVLVIVIAVAALALRSSIGHFKGEGGCCDTGGGTLPGGTCPQSSRHPPVLRSTMLNCHSVSISGLAGILKKSGR